MREYPILTKCYKGLFPFKLATTSYIYPDHIIPNVTTLAPFLDEVELVLFESEGQDNLPDHRQLSALINFSRRQEVKFNVHLPIDIFLGDEREETRHKGISVIRKVMERTLPLNPSLYTLHLDLRDKTGQDHSDIEAWRSRITRSLEEIMGQGIEPNRVSVETLRYPFEWIEDIVEKFGFSICLDIGHILIYGQDLRLYFDKYLAHTSIIHLHGYENGVDHLGIDRIPEEGLKSILSRLYDYKGIVSLEVFSIDDLQRSLTALEERWEKS